MIGHSSCISSDEESQHDQTLCPSLVLVMITYLKIVLFIGFLDAQAYQEEPFDDKPSSPSQSRSDPTTDPIQQQFFNDTLNVQNLEYVLNTSWTKLKCHNLIQIKY